MSPGSAPSDRPADPLFRETQSGFLVLELVTEVRPDGVYVRLAPLQRSFRHVPADEIAAVGEDAYSAADHGGWHWGVRVGPTGDTTAYRISGRDGVTLDLRDGTTVFIGSRRPDELAAAVRAAKTDA